MKIYGHLVVQNGVGEVLRMIDSVFPIVDEFLVIDGGSTDGTWDVLKRYQEAYRLSLMSHSFDTICDQRNRLLEATDKDSWIVTLDHDEVLNHNATRELRDFLLKGIDPELYSLDKRKHPLTIGMPYYSLLDSPLKYATVENSILNNRVFYYDQNMQFFSWYHTRPAYTAEDEVVSMIKAPVSWAIFHSAYLDTQRIADVEKDIASGKRQYTLEQWDLTKKIAAPLPQEVL